MSVTYLTVLPMQGLQGYRGGMWIKVTQVGIIVKH